MTRQQCYPEALPPPIAATVWETKWGMQKHCLHSFAKRGREKWRRKGFRDKLKKCIKNGKLHRKKSLVATITGFLKTVILLGGAC